MELTETLITTIEITIADLLSIYRGAPYTVGIRRGPGNYLEVTVSGNDYGNGYRIGSLGGLSHILDRFSIEQIPEVAFAGYVQGLAATIERQLATYLRGHPAPAPAPRNTDYRIDLDPLPNYRDWGTYRNTISAADNAITQAIIGQRVTQAITNETAITVTVPELEPVRTSRYQLLASGEGIV
jgi:hypothetical protein